MNKKIDFLLYLLMIAAMILFVSYIHSCDSKRKQEKKEYRGSLSKEERIEYDKEHSLCTKVTGSRPVCWREKDWDVFFHEYCKRVTCK